ncbi:MAG: asparaginase [Phaeodactylibacter sp.]|nr:asparaginase [Phaeodactylibacter sp.]
MTIGIINTGGTISSIGEPLHPMSAKDFANASIKILNPVIKQAFPTAELDYITDLEFPESKSKTLDSTNLQPTDWCRMAKYILDHYEKYEAGIILHGTDTMDFSGSALPFLLSAFDADGIPTAVLSKAIIITRSEERRFYETNNDPNALNLRYNTDAFQNFCGAVASAQAGIPEVCVFFHSYLFRGNRVLKTNASEFDAFSSPNFPPLAESGIDFTLYSEHVLPTPVSYEVSLDNPQVLLDVQQQLDYIMAHIDSQPVMQFSAFPAWYVMKDPTDPNSQAKALLADLIDAVVAKGIKGLILESYGEGNFPSGDPDNPKSGAIYQALKRANESGIVIIDCTQVISGVVNDSAYASGAWLSDPEINALNSLDMTSMAAFDKLMILLTIAEYRGWDLATIKKLVQMDLRGEMMDISRLDSRGRGFLLGGEYLSTLDGSATLVNDPNEGPLLIDNKTGDTLWCPIANPSADDLPGRLVMQNDGNLVFYSQNNHPMWASNTGVPTGASSMLILSGTHDASSIRLEVYDYSNRMVTAILY